jgi:hypothetical protein
MIHKTDRNIVRADSMGQVLDISFGPSDDDFHYKKEHATISHANEHGHAGTESKVGVKLIFQGGGCEVQWAHGDGFTEEYSLDGYLGVTPDGMLTLPFWSADENNDQKVPFYVEFDSNGLRVFTYEGAPPDDERDKWLVFDSNTID